jgi:high-affinity iron transporter
LALFLLASSFSSNQLNTLIGAILGLTGAIAVGWLLNLSTHKISLRRFFQVSNYLLVLFAAGLFTQSIHEFAEIGWIPTGLDPLYNISAVLSQQSFGGGILKTLFGYNPKPMLAETLAYVIYLAFLIFLTIIPWRKTNQPA